VGEELMMSVRTYELNNVAPGFFRSKQPPQVPTFEDVKRVTLAWLDANYPDYANADVELTLMESYGVSREVFGIRDANPEPATVKADA
jgi:hypothetical protein